MAMTLRLTDDETAALRARAELEQRSMQEVARAAWRVARPMVLFLRAEDLLYVASRVLGEQPLVLGINGRRLTCTNDEAYDFIVAIATGDWRDSITFKLRAAGIPFEDIPIVTSSEHYSRADIIRAADHAR